VFLSDGSQVDSADPTISVTIPTLSAQSLGLSSYATGTMDLTNQPSVGNTVQLGQETYTFVASGAANAAGDVALGSNVQGTLENLQNAVNGTGTASPGTYGVGTAVNQAAQITSVNGGSATVQATAAGSAGNAVRLVTNLTSAGGASAAALSGAVNATYDTGTLTLGAQPGVISTATGSVSMTGQPITLTRATGIFNLGANQPTAASTPRNPSENLGLLTDSSRGVSRGVVCALHPLRPSWLGASEESGPDDEKGAQKASSCGLGGFGAGDCR
jgi:hypothetical protein